MFTTTELEFIASRLRPNDAYPICGEVYEYLVFAPARHVPLMTLPGMAERTLRIGSAGKTFCLNKEATNIACVEYLPTWV